MSIEGRAKRVLEQADYDYFVTYICQGDIPWLIARIRSLEAAREADAAVVAAAIDGNWWLAQVERGAREDECEVVLEGSSYSGLIEDALPDLRTALAAHGAAQ